MRDVRAALAPFFLRHEADKRLEEQLRLCASSRARSTVDADSRLRHALLEYGLHASPQVVEDAHSTLEAAERAIRGSERACVGTPASTSALIEQTTSQGPSTVPLRQAPAMATPMDSAVAAAPSSNVFLTAPPPVLLGAQGSSRGNGCAADTGAMPLTRSFPWHDGTCLHHRPSPKLAAHQSTSSSSTSSSRLPKQLAAFGLPSCSSPSLR